MLFYAFLLLLFMPLADVVGAMKVHTPKSDGLAFVGSGTVPVAWSAAQDAGDPPRFALMVNRPVGGATTLVPGVVDVPASTGRGVMNVPLAIGTFFISAVDPDDPLRVFAQSKLFTVTPTGINNIESTNDRDDVGDAAQAGFSSSSSTLPSLPSPSASALPGPALKPAVIGGIVAGVLLILLVIGTALFVLRRRARARADVQRSVTFHRSRMVRQPGGGHDPEKAAAPGAGPAVAAAPPNAYLAARGAGLQAEFDDVSVEGSAISISTDAPTAAAPSSYAASSISRAQSTRAQPALYAADLAPQRYKHASRDREKDAYPFAR
ncbi:hypothetical protein MIND_00914600 [Mycena indigotica]|uniref:Uncharacterized protein n=1 Tax=Mycena indigotica TaxID=2126181 RepID=A0A8H6VWQ1_9AGAR|nr:uncharacterized protein MIND_00914600 [Mycena indigotica]KAF7296834.1 hypothetical protein MIND_00914600 [Mycena indigotica]